MKPSFLAVFAILWLSVLPNGRSASGDLPESVLDQIVDTFAGNAYRLGQATAFSVGITLNGKTFFKSYGYKSFDDGSASNQINEHSTFEIGSVTKIFTTALVGQAVATGTLTTNPIGIYTTLAEFPGALPSLREQTKAVTIGELASFTAGFPDVGDTNGNGNRPPISVWGVSDFVTAISQLVPMNYNVNPQVAVSLPAPYFYSDWSTGLLGLLVANSANSALPADAVDKWFSLVQNGILTPLGLTNTYLFNPISTDNVVLGYEQATGKAIVKFGRLSAVTIESSGGRYSSAPPVSIEQPGGGTGATAKAIVQGTAPNLSVRKIVITNPGRGYSAGPQVEFLGGGGSGATGQAVVLNGEITGIQILQQGSGYQSPPKVRIGADRRLGRGAKGTALISNGAVIGVNLTDGGSGYLPPPTIRIAPGDNIVNVVPVWAAAGALKSSASDLVKICQMYLGQQEVDSQSVPVNLSLGGRFAIQPLVQNTSTDATAFTGMAWQVNSGDIEGGFNLRVIKDGGLPGFASYVVLVPAIKLGVVILRSNNQSTTAEYEDPIGNIADAIARAIQSELMPVPL